MEKVKDAKVYIIGAGVSGLVAALNLEAQGYQPIILEGSQDIGGRVKTDIVDGFQLDRGFQVLLEAYPFARKYLDYESLQLQPLSPGAILFEKGKGVSFGDLLRDRSFLFPTLFTGRASLRDKWHIYRLRTKLKDLDFEAMFSRTESSTYDYLKASRFSDKVIHHFFRPFFAGIYLENDLVTSSRMFEFVYKMFGEGNACIPKKGIGAIPTQLASKLKNTDIRLETKVSRVDGDQIHLETGAQLLSDFTIIATNPEGLVPQYASAQEWKSCDTLYFKTPRRTIQQPVIGLQSSGDSLVNNIFYPTSIETEQRGKEELLSVTIVKDHSHEPAALIKTVEQELADHFGIQEVTFLKHYAIPHALPVVRNLKYSLEPSESRLTEKLAIAGDQLVNSSLNAAMQSGEAAASIAHQSLSTTLLTLG